MKLSNSNIVVVDIDGTIADCQHRVPLLKKGDDGHKKFLDQCDKDTPIPAIIRLVEELNLLHMIVFCTAREETQRAKTVAWLKNHLPFLSYYALLMKADGDTRNDDIVKPGILMDAKVMPENVLLILDDRTRVVKAWRKAGYTCLQVANGDF